MNILTVPFVSQILPGALQHRNDCGAASALMILQAYKLGLDLTVDKVYDQIYPAGDAPLSVGELQTYLAKYGVKNKRVGNMPVHDLFDSLVAGCPVIALIHYRVLVEAGLTEKTGFLGAHFLVVIGVDIEDVCVNDPYSDQATLGKGFALEVPINVFQQAWGQCYLDGNPNNVGICMTVPIQDLSVPLPPPAGVAYTFAVYNGIQVNAVNLRSGPASAYPLVGYVERNKTPIIQIRAGKISGDYGQLADGSGWVYLPYFRKV